MLVLISGCETFSHVTIKEDVKPWQKGVLAEPAMQFPQDAMHSYIDEHIYFSKEASSGVRVVGGGGCGCN